MNKKILFRGIASLMALLTAIASGGTVAAFQNAGFINTFLGVDTASGSELTGDYVYTSSYTADGIPSDEGLTQLLKEEDAFNEQVMEEGAVLLKNDGALPLENGERKVTLFGRSTADPVYRYSAAGGSIDGTTRLVGLKEAMENKGFTINQTLYDAYAASPTSRVISANGKENVIGEEDSSFYTNTLQDSFSSYNDAAIVMFSRDGGEGMDVARSDSEGISLLALHQSEKDLLNMIYESGEFSKIIVLINSAYPMELGWLDEYHVDACLWIGAPGLNGFNGVPDILTGDANPCGKLVDTYATDSLSAPAMMNFGNYSFDGSENNYVVEAEGIYTGYKYYETRYEDAVLNRFNAKSSKGVYASANGEWNYADEIVYPFGYGLSYTTFEQSLKQDSFCYDEDTDTYSVDVMVTNTGDVAGRNVVELYAQTPYTEYDQENLVEKSAITLVGFAKTGLLQSGESETVTINVDRYFLTSYDTNGSGHYILDGGTYYMAIGNDAHEALNNILANKLQNGDYEGADILYDHLGNEVTGNVENSIAFTIGEEGSVDDQSYYYSQYTGNEVTNAFDGDNAIDINSFYEDNVVTYLSRQDWDGTYPETVSLKINDAIKNALNARTYSKSNDAKSVSDFVLGEDSGIKFLDMAGAEYDDERWDTFLNQLSLEDLASVLSDGGGNKAVESVSKPASKNVDGPDGVNQKYKYGNKEPATCYPSEVLFASAWDTELMNEFGTFYAEDMLYTGCNQCWGPGANLHRTPFSGRNFEYYSEDANLTYLLSTAQVKPMVEKGVQVGIKHFSGNDQETNRMGVATFMTEQRFRQECLRAFEGAITKGGALGLMSAYNRVGCVNSALNKPLLTTILRDEWGFKGYAITDASGGENDNTPTVECVMAGTDMFCIGSRDKVMVEAVNANDDGDLLEALREVNHRYYYTMTRNLLLNGLSDEATVKSSTPWWQTALIVIIAMFGSAFVVFTVLFALPEQKPHKKKA